MLELTDKGRALLAGISDAWSAVDDMINEVLGSKAAKFFDLARKLRGGLGGSVPGRSTRNAPIETVSKS